VHRKPSIVIVTPALADANNGNWQTAKRWAHMLAAAYRVSLVRQWSGGDEALMIALHARRSADSVQGWHAAREASGAWRPVLLVLTGTDLYRDIASDAAAQRSLALADRLVTLNQLGPRQLPPELRHRCEVVLQSCSARAPLAKTARHLRVLMVGHLRAEKDPLTYLQAAERLAGRGDMLFDHVGAALDPALGAAAQALMARHPRYRWLGALPHARVRRLIQAAHVLVHPSRMEGGAHVVIEALRSGTPVLASRIDGNLGLLGEDYPGRFEPGDAAGLAALIERARDDAAMLPALQRLGAERAPLFSPEAESAALHHIVHTLLQPAPTGAPHERP
jgi:putative glycosyltransferase (TIGR04348 family)